MTWRFWKDPNRRSFLRPLSRTNRSSTSLASPQKNHHKRSYHKLSLLLPQAHPRSSPNGRIPKTSATALPADNVRGMPPSSHQTSSLTPMRILRPDHLAVMRDNGVPTPRRHDSESAANHQQVRSSSIAD